MKSAPKNATDTGAVGKASPSRFITFRQGLPRAAGAAVLAVLLGVTIVALLGQYGRTVSLERAAIAREASTVIGAVEAGINIHVRPGAQYREERLESYLEQLIETSPALAIALMDQNEVPFLAAGDIGLLEDPPYWAEATVESAWMPKDGRAGFHGRVDPRGGARGPGRGQRTTRSQWSEFPGESYDVAVIMDTGDLDERIGAAKARLGSSLMGLAVLLLLGGVALSLSARRRSLETQLFRARERAAQQERVAQLGAGLAHETRNPLGVVRGLMQSITSDTASSESLRGTAKEAIDELDRAVGRINSFLKLARPVEPDQESVPLKPLLEGVTRLLETEAPPKTSIENVACEERLSIMADHDMLRRCLFNIGINALRAIEPGGTVRFEAKAAANGTAEIRVTDDGQGIDPRDLPRVTEPYFSTTDEGSGLGLAIVERIASGHGWKLHIDSEPAKGTQVSLTGMKRV